MAVLRLNPGDQPAFLLQRCFEVGNTACLGCAGLAALAPSDMAVCRGLFAVGVLTAFQREQRHSANSQTLGQEVVRRAVLSSTDAHHGGLRGEGGRFGR
jgi:hypothetical protein